uniref:Uncharacterized protein n=1 Tax=Arundo donax TaxID=35708 RepID=A0A0A8ZUI1_ARUDO
MQVVVAPPSLSLPTTDPLPSAPSAPHPPAQILSFICQPPELVLP